MEEGFFTSISQVRKTHQSTIHVLDLESVADPDTVTVETSKGSLYNCSRSFPWISSNYLFKSMILNIFIP